MSRPALRSLHLLGSRNAHNLHHTSPIRPHVTPHATHRRAFSGPALILSITGIALTSYTLGSLFPPTLLTFLSPRIAPPPPDPSHPDAISYVESLEETLQSLPLLLQHREATEAAGEDWYETRPYLKVPEERRVNSLTAGALRGPGRLALPPLVRAKRDESEGWVFVHVGRGLCGHDGVIHGGLLATLLDESLARVAILNLPEKIGVTARLNINYKAPTLADQFIVLKIKLVEAKGRRTKVVGTVEDLSGKLLVEADALFVQPRYAQLLNSSAIAKVMGEPGDGARVPGKIGADKSGGEGRREVGEAMMEGEGESKNGVNALGNKEAGEIAPSGQGKWWKFR